MGSSTVIRESSISVVAGVLIVALGPIQFGITQGYSSPTQSAIVSDLGLTVSESVLLLVGAGFFPFTVVITYSNFTDWHYQGVTSSNAPTFWAWGCSVIATAVTTWLVDKTGRRLLLIISSLGMTVSLLVAISFYVQDFLSTSSHLYTIFSIFSAVGVVAMVVTFSLGIGPIPWVIMSKILPINIKALAGSIATLCNWLFSFVITMTANFLLDWSSGCLFAPVLSRTFTIHMLTDVFTVTFVVVWVPETKGRAPEEIQMSFR